MINVNYFNEYLLWESTERKVFWERNEDYTFKFPIVFNGVKRAKIINHSFWMHYRSVWNGLKQGIHSKCFQTVYQLRHDHCRKVESESMIRGNSRKIWGFSSTFALLPYPCDGMFVGLIIIHQGFNLEKRNIGSKIKGDRVSVVDTDTRENTYMILFHIGIQSLFFFGLPNWEEWQLSSCFH